MRLVMILVYTYEPIIQYRTPNKSEIISAITRTLPIYFSAKIKLNFFRAEHLAFKMLLYVNLQLFRGSNCWNCPQPSNKCLSSITGLISGTV